MMSQEEDNKVPRHGHAKPFCLRCDRCHQTCTPDKTQPHFALNWARQSDSEQQGEAENPYSDWTIVVESCVNTTSSTAAKATTYTVHTKMLESKSEYFKTLFQGGDRFNESKKRISSFQFPNVVARNFYLFLDSIYWYGFFDTQEWNDAAAAVGIQGKCVMLYLLDYFQVDVCLYEQCVRSVFSKTFNLKEIRECIQLSREELPVRVRYLRGHVVASVHSFLFCSSHYYRDPTQSELNEFLTEIDVSLLVACFKKKDRLYDDDGETAFAKNLAFVLKQRSSEIDADAFRTLTSMRLLSNTPAEAAIEMLKVVDVYEDKFSDDDNECIVLREFETRCMEIILKLVAHNFLSVFDNLKLSTSMSLGHLKRLLNFTIGAAELAERNTSPRPSDPTPETLVKCIRDLLEKKRAAYADRLTVTSGHPSVNGTYVRKGYCLYEKYGFAIKIQDGLWTILHEDVADHTNSNPSTKDGYPPLRGWVNSQGEETDLTIWF